MKQVHVQEKHQFKKLFKQEHIDNFEDRFKVLEAFLQIEKHVTVDEIGHQLEENGWEIESEFVRETLKLMCRFGFAHKSRFNNGVVLYEHRHLGQHHDHMICLECGMISEFFNPRLEALQEKLAEENNFSIYRHRLELYGSCKDKESCERRKNKKAAEAQGA